ncbi:hypothetical protein DB30_04111 [Enhygromyxa salina]|uniref:Uncharacterized protein n=1 Tax=Enhygromyxa salina TaxID=215803 RepID=A0A0C2DA50_9BACT|nr:hypothetical protein [Enhygromyxa salina]KIG16767.1 hypothetical protein DB30_04111 [Enhygromyxa salina]
MAYRDEQQALMLEVATLERENHRLQAELTEAEQRFKGLLSGEYEQRRKTVRKSCVMCSGNLLPVAIVAGHDVRNPLPLKMSTLRFGSPEGGFTASAPVRSYACGTCGYIHNFIDMDLGDLGGSLGEVG